MFKTDKTFLSRLSFTIRNLRSISQHHYGNGPLSILKLIYYSLLRVNTFILFERRLDDGPNPIHLPSGYTVTKPSIQDLESMRERRNLPREFYYDRFHNISNCYVVMHGEEPAYIHWIYVRGDTNRFLKLGDGVAEVNYITTLPEYRGKKLMASMMILTMNDLKRMGYRKLVSVVNTLNPPALKSMLAAGFKEARKIRTLGYLSRKYTIDA